MKHKEASRKRTSGNSANANVPKTEKRKPERPKSTYNIVSSLAHLEKSEKASLEAITVTPPVWTKPPKLPRPIVNKLKPWEEQPYKLLSWWDMEKFSAAAFQQIVMGLVIFTGKIEVMPPDIEAGDLAVKYIPMVRSIRDECEKIGLRTSMVCADDFIALADGMTVKMLTEALREFQNTIRREMQTCMFFHMPSSQSEYYGKNMLFGARVDVRIPSTQFDIKEAGNCYAMGRGTACVFHLMRVVEVGVQKLGDQLGVPLAQEKNWQVILDLVNKAVKSLPANAPKTVALSQVAAHLYNVKVGWRNPVMHPRETYTLEEAGDLIESVKTFMKTLSDLLPVPKSGPSLVK